MEKKKPLAEKWTGAYLTALFGFFPLILHNGYFDVMETKFASYLLLTALWLLGLFWLAALGRGPAGEGFGPGVLCCLAFCAVGILSSLLGGYARAALFAADNRYQGILAMLLYAAMCAALCRSDPGRSAVAALLVSFGLNALLGVANFCGADPLRLMTKLSAFDRGRFLGLIGNINFFGAYMTLLTPLAAALCCSAEKRGHRVLLAALSLLGLLAAMAGRSESAVLGLGAAAVLLPLFVREERRSLWIPPLGIGAMQLFALLTGRNFSALTEILLLPAVSATLLLLWLGAYALALRSRRTYAFMLLGLTAAVVLTLVLANTVIDAARLGPLGEWLILDADFGSDRGAVWRSCLALYGELPWWQKLIGGGSGVLARWDMLHRLFPDAVVDSAHNEYLHCLLTHGLVGLGAYLGWIFFALRRALRSRDPLYAALGLGAAAYAVQASVNIAQSATTPLFFALLALLSGGEPLDSEDTL
ncbi:MAG: O-antigen ligase family protein [Ruminococcaceae bacterium]|nr:O-antigen ligase family protein [Oscillospiraceae bacterium]